MLSVFLPDAILCCPRAWVAEFSLGRFVSVFQHGPPPSCCIPLGMAPSCCIPYQVWVVELPEKPRFPSFHEFCGLGFVPFSSGSDSHCHQVFRTARCGWSGFVPWISVGSEGSQVFEEAVAEAKAQTEKPSLLVMRTTIGCGAGPAVEGTRDPSGPVGTRARWAKWVGTNRWESKRARKTKTHTSKKNRSTSNQANAHRQRSQERKTASKGT